MYKLLLLDIWATSTCFCAFGLNLCIPGLLFALELLLLAFILVYFLPQYVPSWDYPFPPHSCSPLFMSFCKEKINFKKATSCMHSSSELICLPFLPPQCVEYFHSQILRAFSVSCLNNSIDSSSASPQFLFVLLPQVFKLDFFF